MYTNAARGPSRNARRCHARERWPKESMFELNVFKGFYFRVSDLCLMLDYVRVIDVRIIIIIIRPNRPSAIVLSW